MGQYFHSIVIYNPYYITYLHDIFFVAGTNLDIVLSFITCQMLLIYSWFSVGKLCLNLMEI